jgi:uncharacterized protein YktB (UPF0637 family)
MRSISLPFEDILKRCTFRITNYLDELFICLKLIQEKTKQKQKDNILCKKSLSMSASKTITIIN